MSAASLYILLRVANVGEEKFSAGVRHYLFYRTLRGLSLILCRAYFKSSTIYRSTKLYVDLQ